jgi:hypothetical protein
MRELRVLRMLQGGDGSSVTVGVEVVSLIASLPHLHTLEAACCKDARVWCDLSSALLLTSLRITDVLSYAEHAKSILPMVTQAGRLRHLEIVEPYLWGSAFREFFTGPSVARLESVVGHRFEMQAVKSPFE